MIEPRTPVIVGVGQTQQHADDVERALEPIDLFAEAARAAAVDAHATRSLLSSIDTIGVVAIVSWPSADPGAVLARHLGVDVARTVLTTVGGNSPQLLLNCLAVDIADGVSDVVLLGGTECFATRRRARRQDPKLWLPWSEEDVAPCPEVIGDARAGNSEYELAHLAASPILVYPLLETAIRSGLGRSVDEHQRALSELWATFAAVAEHNPHAWSQRTMTPEAIRTPAPDNRVITFPYLKVMCARMEVDQAAAVLLCSYETARAHGVPDDRMVFPLGGAGAHDHFFFTERDALDASPAIAAAGRAALGAAGLGIDDVARFDLYSCFPAAVELSSRALGLAGPLGGDPRPLTVTGGLAFAGGPMNNYPTHAIAAMVDACRADPGSVGLVHALGWYATKHAIGCYSTTPPADGFRHVDPRTTQAEVDAQPGRVPAGAYSGTATIEATAVSMERDGTPAFAIVSLLSDDGRRVLANSREADMLHSMMDEAWEGKTATVSTDGTTNTLEP